jgi:hypothetical protein
MARDLLRAEIKALQINLPGGLTKEVTAYGKMPFPYAHEPRKEDSHSSVVLLDGGYLV